MSKIIYNQIIGRGKVYYLVLYRIGKVYHCLGLKYRGDYKRLFDKFGVHSNICDSRWLLFLESEHIHKINIRDLCLFRLHHKKSPRFVILNKTDLKIDYHMTVYKDFEKRYNVDKSYLDIEYRSGKISYIQFDNFPRRLEDACLGAFENIF